MFYAYVIKSMAAEYLYKGHCSCMETRINQHNSGMTSSIKKYAPFKLVYFETFETLAEAVDREQYFKTAAGRRFLKFKILKT